MLPRCLWLLAFAAACGGAPDGPTRGLSPEQIQFSGYWPRDYLLDVRAAADSSTAADVRSGALRLDAGWSDADREGRWALGNRSTILVNIASRTDLNLFFEYRSPGVEAIKVTVNDVGVGELPSEPTWHTELVALPEGALRTGFNTIELTYTPGPGGFPLRTQEGWLTVYFRTIGVIASDEPEPLESGAVAFSRAGETLTVAQPGTLLIPFRTLQPLASASLGASMESLWWRGADLDVRYLGASGTGDGPDPSFRASVGGLFRRSLSTELALEGRSGPGCFVLDIDVDPSGPPVRLDHLEVQEVPPPATSELSSLPEPPDIVLIILDAARADHFGAYGYERDTSPNIDRLADESLVFETVLATAPYTLSSMATMLTGLSFTQHGVTERGHTLAESVTTLAEFFREEGYQTACLSANPNNSVALGLDQGCDVFEEFWRNTPPPASLDPYRVSRRALAELDRAREQDQPLFLMLHYVPPHEPYTPALEFDLFGDDDYAGDYDGSLTTILGIERGELQPTAADLAEVISLYDGNLRTGDDAVGMVLDELRAHPRWDRTVVLVTSDHGEAFGEHGRMSHNTTVYDEMLHVPFILRLPGSQTADVDTRSLGSLADVTPTLLGLAGVQPRSRLYGQDLLAPRTGAGGRRVVSRSGGDRPSFGYRTERWKAIIGRRPERQLFDLRADPSEANDLYLDEYETFACLEALLQWELSGAVTAAGGGDDRELSEEDIRTLRSLGYIR